MGLARECMIGRTRSLKGSYSYAFVVPGKNVHSKTFTFLAKGALIFYVLSQLKTLTYVAQFQTAKHSDTKDGRIIRIQ